jgi:hypothetical protein
VDRPLALRPAGQEQGAHPGLRGLLARSQEKAPDPTEIVIPPAAARATSSSKRRSCEGYGNNLLIDDLEFKLPPAASSASSARTARASPRCSA